MDMNDFPIIPNFSAIRMKREIQRQLQEKTAGMSFEEWRRFLDEAPAPQENSSAGINMAQGEKIPCPCCGYKTFYEEPNGTYIICPVCFWEDDPVQLEDPDYEGGANYVSLRQGQRNFIEFGTCEKRFIEHVRKSAKDEQRDSDWKPL